MKTYKYADNTRTVVLVIDSDGLCRCSGLAAFVVAQGSQILDPDAAPIVVPFSVTRRQFKQGLTRLGLRVAVEGFVAAGDQDTKDWYIESDCFERAHPVLIAAATALGVSSAQVDAGFILMATL